MRRCCSARPGCWELLRRAPARAPPARRTAAPRRPAARPRRRGWPGGRRRRPPPRAQTRRCPSAGWRPRSASRSSAPRPAGSKCKRRRFQETKGNKGTAKEKIMCDGCAPSCRPPSWPAAWPRTLRRWTRRPGRRRWRRRGRRTMRAGRGATPQPPPPTRRTSAGRKCGSCALLGTNGNPSERVLMKANH